MHPCERGRDYLVEIETTGALRAPDLEEGLELLRWTDGEDGPPILDLSLDEDEGVHRHRFVGHATESLELEDTPSLTWTRVLALPFDPFADITKKMKPFELETGTTYALRFLTRMKATPKRSNVEGVLRSMGFQTEILSCLKRNIRIEGRPAVSCALWCGIARWDGPKSMHAFEDPISIEDLCPVLLASTGLETSWGIPNDRIPERGEAGAGAVGLAERGTQG